MIQIADTQDCDDGESTLAIYVLDRLPNDYLITENDLKWLDVCSDYLTDKPTNETVLTATKKAVEVHEFDFHVDPFELLIDAKICDIQCNPIL